MTDKGCPEPGLTSGSRLYGFNVQRVEAVPEIRATAYEMEHETTGAKILHLHCSDRENLYSIGFRTPPRDSTGVAHILEHSVLAGSERYPVKDAFNELARSTLQTFINAFTYPDKTLYPVASQVKKDFFNLAAVYSDLVFHPRLAKDTFYQEGHHLDFEDPGDPQSRLTVSGIVYNEMKGVYSSPDSLMWKEIQENLYPDTPYAFDSGGNPEAIISLTYEQLRAFHRTYYSPSNSRFFIYGDIPTREHLAFLAEVLSGFQRLTVSSGIPLQGRWKKPRRVEGFYPIATQGDRSGKTAVNVAWMAADNEDHETVMLLKIIARALIGSAAGPLRKALIDSGLGEDLSPVTGIDSDLRQVAFAIGLRGTEADKADDIESLILTTVENLSRVGIDRDILEGSLHRIEFSGREILRRSYPYGITLMSRVYHTWLYDGDPLAALRFSSVIEGIRSRWTSDPDLFQKVLRRWFVENPHRILSILRPSESLMEERDDAFRKRMNHSKASLSSEELADIHREADNLRKRQAEPDSVESLAALPVLRIEDVPRLAERVPSEASCIEGIPVLKHDIFTNGIAYADVAFDVSHVPEELQPLLPLLGKLTIGMGAEGWSYDEMAKRIALKTGGLDYQLVSGMTADGTSCWQKMIFSFRTLYRNLSDAWTMVSGMLCDGDLSDETRMRDLIFEKKNRLHSSVIPSGHLFAKRSAAAGLSLPAYREEQWHGRTQLDYLSRVSAALEREKGLLGEKLMRLRRRVFNRDHLMVNMTAEEEAFDGLSEGARALIRRIPGGGEQAFREGMGRRLMRLGVAIPAQVCYVARAFPAPAYHEPIAASLTVLSRILSSGYLYHRIRVQGGAYGGMSSYDPLSGYLCLISYRDPHLSETLKVYDEAADFISKETMTDGELEKGIIGTIGAMDRPMDPALKGFTAMIRTFAGLKDDERQRFRDQVFSITTGSLKEAGRLYLSSDPAQSSTVVYAMEERLRLANQALDPPLRIESLTSPA